MSRFQIGEKCMLGKDIVEIVDVWLKDKRTLEQYYLYKYINKKINGKICTDMYLVNERYLEKIINEE